jgi:hypothetical protein
MIRSGCRCRSQRTRPPWHPDGTSIGWLIVSELFTGQVVRFVDWIGHPRPDAKAAGPLSQESSL